MPKGVLRRAFLRACTSGEVECATAAQLGLAALSRAEPAQLMQSQDLESACAPVASCCFIAKPATALSHGRDPVRISTS